MSEAIDKIDEAIEHIADFHEDLVVMMMLEKAKEYVRELEDKVKYHEGLLSEIDPDSEGRIWYDSVIKELDNE